MWIPNRREFLTSTAALAGSAAVARRSSAVTRSADSRPNVVLIMSDDHGYGDLSCFGNPHVKTPNIDRLYGESTRLTQYHNSPVCTPTRASLMTGRYNYRTCAIDTFRGRAMMHPDEVTIAEILSGAGYKTGIFGKWHLGDCFPMRACDQGFQESLVHHGGGLAQPSDRPDSGGYFDPVLLRNGVLEKHTGYCTDIFAAESIAFMERHRDEPFFLYLPTNAPHVPLIVDDRYAQPYRNAGLNEKLSKFYGMVSNLDENVGKVLDAIDRLGLREDTIVIFITDNGAQYGDETGRFTAGMRGQKGTVYEGGIRVPCFVRWPGKLGAGREVTNLAAHIDVLPTILDFCRVERPNAVKFDGQSLRALLVGETDTIADRTLFFQWHRGDVPEPYNNCCARNQRFKLVNGVELYDLESDPAEERDIAPASTEIVHALRKQYEAWLDDVSSTRGYEPPEIILGDDRANPVYLTLQDMRGGESGGYGMGGYWKTRVKTGGSYEVTLRFSPDIDVKKACLQVGGVRIEQTVADMGHEIVLSTVGIPDGPASVRAWANSPDAANGARYVDIRRL